VTEVVADQVAFLEPKGQTNNQQSQSKPQQNKENNEPLQGQGEPVDISDDDLPF